MKKLLVLALVLGVASLANAGLAFTVGGVEYASGSTVAIDGQTTIGLVNDTEFDGVPDVAYIEVAPGAEVVGSGTVGTVLPGTWSIVDYGLSYGLYYWQISNTVAGVGDSLVGTMFTVDVAGPTTLNVYQSDWATIIGSIELASIPEPMTMGLLGLGGLFLARRKK